jgi:hypothetical protein
MTDTAPKETAKAAQAFADYVAMGPERSLRKLVEKYHRPKSYLAQLNVWSTEYEWQARLKEMAEQQIAEAAGLRTETYVAIAREYHRRFTDPAMVKVAQLDALHGVFDRVKPTGSRPTRRR